MGPDQCSFEGQIWIRFALDGRIQFIKIYKSKSSFNSPSILTLFWYPTTHMEAKNPFLWFLGIPNLKLGKVMTFQVGSVRRVKSETDWGGGVYATLTIRPPPVVKGLISCCRGFCKLWTLDNNIHFRWTLGAVLKYPYWKGLPNVWAPKACTTFCGQEMFDPDVFYLLKIG